MNREPSAASLELAEQKLAEASWFIDEFESAGPNVFVARCLASAGLSACVSALNALRAASSRDDGFKDWTRDRTAKLREDPVIAYLFERRNEMAHVGDSRINAGTMSQEDGETKVRHYFSRGPWKAEAIDMDVGSAMRHFAEEIESLLAAAKAEFPEQTAEWHLDLQRLYSEGYSVEDIESYVGFPRGWTDIEGFTDEKRIELLQREI
jgi:hypothetical protein